MRIAVFALLLLSLGACAEVTTFRRSDGSVYHHVNCGDSMKLESCRNAAERTCPNGFDRMNIRVAGDASRTRRCADDNDERRRNGEQELACPAEKHADNFFICK